MAFSAEHTMQERMNFLTSSWHRHQCRWCKLSGERTMCRLPRNRMLKSMHQNANASATLRMGMIHFTFRNHVGDSLPSHLSATRRAERICKIAVSHKSSRDVNEHPPRAPRLRAIGVKGGPMKATIAGPVTYTYTFPSSCRLRSCIDTTILDSDHGGLSSPNEDPDLSWIHSSAVDRQEMVACTLQGKDPLGQLTRLPMINFAK